MKRQRGAPRRTASGLVSAIVIGALLAGCSAADRIANIGSPPDLTPIANPVQAPDYQPVTMPMPPAEPVERQAASLWRPGSRAFFRDQRAQRVGDILTVVINIDDEASINNTSSRSRDNTETANLNRFFGYEGDLDGVLPEAIDPSNLVDLDSDAGSTGAGSVDRGEDISLRIAAIITQVLPNGNLVLQGRQEVRVNFELRELLISGVIRREDILADNTIQYDQIAEARISYGGRGQITDVQQPRYGQQLFDIVMPW